MITNKPQGPVCFSSHETSKSINFIFKGKQKHFEKKQYLKKKKKNGQKQRK